MTLFNHIVRLIAAVAVMVAAAGPVVAADTAAAGRRPNVVFFLCDDLGVGDLSCLGSKHVRTPHIDALFARGTRLERHWAGSAVCAPSRCVLMTGRHPGHAAVRSNREVEPEGQTPLPAGPPPDAAAFAAFRGTNYSADLIAAEQLKFVRAHADRPFFLYVPTTVPHLALQVPADEPTLAAYRKQFGDEKPYLGGRGYVPCEQPLATYAAMIARMDRELGRLVALLDELGIADDTIFVFSSNNGAAPPGAGGGDTARLESHGGIRDWKGSPYEGGLRVPTVAVWPGRIPAGRTVATPSGFEDWLPTLLDLAGLAARIPAAGDGTSLAAALRGAAEADAERVLYRELTEGRWQTVRRAAGTERPAAARPVELYDLVADPAEARDVAAAHPALVARMTAILDREHVPDPAWPLPFADAASRAAAD